MKILASLFILIFISVVFTACETDPKQAIVARLGTENITVGELEAKLKNTHRNRPIARISLEDRRKALESMMDERRKMMWAVDNNLEENEKYQKDLLFTKARLVATTFYQKAVIDELVPPALISEYYHWKKVNVEAAMIAIGSNESDRVKEGRSVEEAMALAAVHKKTLANSETPLEAAKKLTEDRTGRFHQNPYQSGSFDETLDRKVNTAAVGDIVGPYNLGGTVFVFKILSRKPNGQAAKEYDAYAGSIMRMLRAKKRAEETKLFETKTAEYQQKYPIDYKPENMARFIEILKAWREKPDPKHTDFSEEELSYVFATLDNGNIPITSGTLVEFHNVQLRKDVTHYETVETLKKNFAEPQANLYLWYLAGKAAGLSDHKDVVNGIRSFKSDRLSARIDEYLAENVDIKEQDIIDYYQANLPKYHEKEAIQIWQIGVKSEEKALELLARVKAGEKLNSLNREYHANLKGSAGKYNLNYQSKDSKHIASVIEAAFTAGPDQVIGPIKVDENYFVLKTGKKREDRVIPVEEVSGAITATLTNDKRNKKREALLKQIRGQYSYRINESILRSLS